MSASPSEVVPISTPENIARVRALLDAGKRVLVTAPRRSGKSTLSAALNADYYAALGGRHKKNLIEKGIDQEKVRTVSELADIPADTDSVVVFDHFRYAPLHILVSFLAEKRPRLCVHTPVDDETLSQAELLQLFDERINL
jgi:hypothetical protein